MPEEWNKQDMKDAAQIEDTSKWKRYRMQVEYRKLETFEEAEQEMKRAEFLNLCLPCTIKQQGHGRHSIALAGCIEDGKMEAFKNWGARDIYTDVTLENFLDAITMDPIITHA